MKKFFIILLIIIILTIIQTSFLSVWFSEYRFPNLVLMFLIASAAIFGFYSIWYWSILAGVFFDIFAYARPGTHVIIFLVAIYLVSFVSRRMLVGERSLGVILVMLLILPITLLDQWGYILLGGSGIPRISGTLLGQILSVILGNFVFFFLSLFVIRRFKKYFGPQEYKIVRN